MDFNLTSKKWWGMKFEFSRQNLKGRERFLERIFEVLPGLTSWTILIGLCVLSFWKPLVAAILIIAFDFYWLLRLFYMTLFLILAYFRLSVERGVDWMVRVREIDVLCHQSSLRGGVQSEAEAIHNLEIASLPLAMTDNSDVSLKRLISEWLHRRKLAFLKQSGSLPPLSSEIYHLVIYSVVKEGKEIIEPGIRALSNQKYMSKHILLVIALEERAEGQIKDEINGLRDQYRDFFFDFLIIEHPNGLPDEARVKGANVTYAAKRAAFYFEEKKILLEHIIVSCFDADTVVHPDYLSCLTYHFMIYPKRDRASFQPIPVYHNNIWEASAFARVLDVGASFFQFIEATNPERLVT
ncbi:MAG: hypothetical protein HYS55_02360, partial [Candidatus Omnitrophica bacterium]|nr:hypothetical protein [Candidatus Omnitrophota bacterium]